MYIQNYRYNPWEWMELHLLRRYDGEQFVVSTFISSLIKAIDEAGEYISDKTVNQIKQFLIDNTSLRKKNTYTELQDMITRKGIRNLGYNILLNYGFEKAANYYKNTHRTVKIDDLPENLSYLYTNNEYVGGIMDGCSKEFKEMVLKNIIY